MPAEGFEDNISLMSKFNRRDFIKSSLIASSAIAFRPASLFAEKSSTIATANGDSPFKLTEKVIESLGGMKAFVSKGDIVMIKPNIGWDRSPEQAANTNPEVVASLVKMALDSGAKTVKVMDNTCNDERRCYVNSGIKKAAEKYGAKVLHVEEFRLRDMKVGGEIIKNWKVYKDFVECDTLINVPILKHHGLAELTMGMKNWLGAVGGRRRALHQNIHITVVDLAAFFKPKLTVLDAYRILLRNGPQGGSLGDVKLKKTLAASTDPVALDAFGIKTFGRKPRDFDHLKVASKRDLGEMDLDKVRVKSYKV